jgi:2-oxoglutarate dehydrogenase complex dihydrolipoamide succinyltransferase (E2 component)
MAFEIKVPPLGESIVEATVGKWLKQSGDAVNAGDPLVELETDKVSLEVTADQAGVLSSIAKAEGETVTVGETLGVISADGAAATAAPAAAPAAAPVAAPAEVAANANSAANSPVASPVAQRLANELNVNINTIQGSGPGGRIMKDDVLKVAGNQKAASAPAPAATAAPAAAPTPAAKPAAPAAPAASFGPEERIRMSRRRQTIAKRLVEAQHTAAMLTTFNEVDMSAVMELRKRRGEEFQKRHGVKLGFMSFFVKAVVGALKFQPRLNAEIQGDELVLKKYYDIGIAVAAEEGLVVPVLRGAERLNFAGIEKGIADLATKARNNALSLSDLQGGTFTITNGGIFGSLMSTPILNAPQVGILGMHSIKERPIAVNGEVVIRPMMYIALSYDHRIVDGSEAVRFLVRVKEQIEDPETLLLDS